MKNAVLSKTKFKYDYLTNRLWKIKDQEPERLYEITEENQFKANFGGEGFVLGNNSWITFTLCSHRIKIFAKLVKDNQITYYRKEIHIMTANKLPLVIPQSYREINFEFTTKDIVIKNDQDYWVPKKESG